MPPIRLILVWDNLAGHQSRNLVAWLLRQGVDPALRLLVEHGRSVQHILGERAPAGAHPRSSAEIIAWLEATVAGWNRVPTPFVRGGKRPERRERAHAGGHAASAARAPPPSKAGQLRRDPLAHPPCAYHQEIDHHSRRASQTLRELCPLFMVVKTRLAHSTGDGCWPGQLCDPSKMLESRGPR